MTLPIRIIHNTDAIGWLNEQPKFEGCSFITSMPDLSEISKFSLEEWKTWFTDTAALIMSRCPDDGIAIFYQSDIKHEGTWVDKGFLVQKAAERVGHALLAHKIVCRSPAGIVTFGRPSYSHLLCFSKGIRFDVKKSTMDVLPSAGAVTWTRGMGVQACRLACKIIKEHTQSHTVVDPFCGHGTALAVANEMGLNAVGVELGRKRAEKAQNITMQDLSN